MIVRTCLVNFRAFFELLFMTGTVVTALNPTDSPSFSASVQRSDLEGPKSKSSLLQLAPLSRKKRRGGKESQLNFGPQKKRERKGSRDHLHENKDRQSVGKIITTDVFLYSSSFSRVFFANFLTLHRGRKEREKPFFFSACMLTSRC